jgi:hypothetical protein
MVFLRPKTTIEATVVATDRTMAAMPSTSKTMPKAKNHP